jgi:hypothetical protein
MYNAVHLYAVMSQVSCALWVLGEYSASREEVEAALAVIHAGLGPLPLLQLESGAHCGDWWTWMIVLLLCHRVHTSHLLCGQYSMPAGAIGLQERFPALAAAAPFRSSNVCMCLVLRAASLLLLITSAATTAAAAAPAEEDADTAAAKDAPASLPSAASMGGSKRPAVLADGTYASQVGLSPGYCLFMDSLRTSFALRVSVTRSRQQKHGSSPQAL